MASRLTSLLLSLLLPIVASAQKKDCPYFLRLQVFTQDSLHVSSTSTPLTPAQNAEIFCELSHSISITNEQGFAVLKGLCASVSDIEINYKGVHYHGIIENQQNITHPLDYCIVVLSPLTNQNKITTAEFEATWTKVHSGDSLSAISMQSALVRARANTQGDAMRSSQLQALPIQTLARSLEPLPMTQTLSTGMGIGKPVVQGMFGQRLPILNNGFRIEGQTWGLDHAPETDLWGAQKVVLLRGTDALAIGADAWGNAINLVNQYDFHAFNRDYTQMVSTQTNGGGIQVAGRLIKGRQKQVPGRQPVNFTLSKHPYGKGHYWLYSAKATGNYNTPTHTLSNTATREASLSYGNLWNSKRGYWGLKGFAEREFHVKAYAYRGGIFSESHIGNVNDLLAAMQRTEPLVDAPFSYRINRPMQQAMHIQASYNNRNQVLGKYIVHHKISLQSNQRWEFDPHRSTKTTFAQLNLWQGTINQYTGFEKLKPASHFQVRWVFQNTSQWQRYAGYYFLPDYQQWQPNLHCRISTQSHAQTQQSLVLRADYLIRNASPKLNGITENLWQRKLGSSAAYSLTKQVGQQQWQLHVSQLWRPPSINELYSRGVHHGAASFEQGNGNLRPETGQKLELLWVKTSQKQELRITTFYQQSQNFIALFPMESPILTVRGAFPAYEYRQLPTQYGGAEIQLLRQWDRRKLQFSMRFGAIYGKITHGQIVRYPNFLPCPKGQLQIHKRWSQATLMIEAIGVGKQPFYTPGSDFLPPPNGYVLFNAQLQLNSKGHDQHAHWVIYGENLANKAYRDYMDRFRYFTNQAGMNVGIKWLYDVHHHDKHMH